MFHISNIGRTGHRRVVTVNLKGNIHARLVFTRKLQLFTNSLFHSDSFNKKPLEMIKGRLAFKSYCYQVVNLRLWTLTFTSTFLQSFRSDLFPITATVTSGSAVRRSDCQASRFKNDSCKMLRYPRISQRSVYLFHLYDRILTKNIDVLIDIRCPKTPQLLA